MLLILQVFVLLLLAIVYLQDMRYRAVSWYVFPLLGVSVISVRCLSGQGITMIAESALINIGVLVMILGMLTLYFMIKHRGLVNITNQYLGIGDILFFLVFGIYLSVLSFLLFFVVSLLFAGIYHAFLMYYHKNRHIPLAGLQALLLMVVLVSDWWCFHQRVTDDYWLLHFYTPWM